MDLNRKTKVKDKLIAGNQVKGKPIIYFIGLSAKPMCEHLSSGTRTGDIIEKIINQLPSINTLKTNLVKTAPLDKKEHLDELTLSVCTENGKVWEEALGDVLKAIEGT